MRKIMCFFGKHKWQYLGTLDWGDGTGTKTYWCYGCKKLKQEGIKL